MTASCGPRIVEADGTAPMHARRFIRSCLHRTGSEALTSAAELLISEVVTNAVVHTDSSECTIEVVVDDLVVRVEVEDSAPGALPRLLAPDDELFGGRGLHIVDATARRWGWEVGALTKLVWFELERPTERR